MSRSFRPSQLVRVGLALGVSLLTVLLLWALLILTDTAFDVWERLQSAPSWFFYLYGGGFLAIAAVGGYALWRLLRPRGGRRAAAPKPEAAASVDREELEQRVQKASEAGIDIAAVRRELALLQERKASGTIHVSFFGEISSGKSSLIKALLPEAELEVSARGGTTREIGQYRWKSPSGDELILTDMPGTNEVGAGLDEMSRAEALRSHVVIYVCDGDLSRSQYDDLTALLELGKPAIVALNKTDRYRREELETLLTRLRERLGEAARVDLVAVQAGGKREAVRVLPDGTEETVVRDLPPRVDELRQALQRRMDEDPEVLERLRDSSVFVLVARRLDDAEQTHRRHRAEELTRSYSKKAMIGAMAAVAPGSDLVIQGYLAVSMVRELANLYDVPVRQMDTDLLLELVQKRVARSTTIMLAIAGNGLKAFPGVGTLVGGLVHAAAYGMIFESLGKAVAVSLESRGALRPAQAAQAFEESLSEDLEARARRFARLALEIQEDARDEPRQASR
ncbi:MAG: GTPase [Pseudomonadota bacterium]|nr:GTPase [Pseudomonadota bacterium]